MVPREAERSAFSAEWAEQTGSIAAREAVEDELIATEACLHGFQHEEVEKEEEGWWVGGLDRMAEGLAAANYVRVSRSGTKSLACRTTANGRRELRREEE